MGLFARKKKIEPPPVDPRAAKVIEAFDPGDFYSPIPSREDLDRSAPARERARAEKEIAGVDLAEATQLETLDAIARFQEQLPFGDAPREGLRYHLSNDWFAHGDGAVFYGMLRHLAPKRVVEIGSGFSSALLLDVRDRFLGRDLACTFVEPNCARLKGLLRPEDHATTTIIERPLQDVPLETFDALDDGDLLFVDSTHVAKIGSDVLRIFFEVLPRLKRGVVVHFHDVFHPFEYPEPWIREGRAWNEAYVLRAFLQYNDAFRVLFFNDWLARFHRQRLERAIPATKKGAGGSIWLRRAR